MIIWISGPYGVGKSTLAEAIAKKMDNAILFDAEEVGNAVRENYPGWPYGVIFEDYPLWSKFCYELLKDIHSSFSKTILVPMTMLRRSTYESILQKLMDDGIDVRLIILEASHKNIHDRILARGEDEDCWCMQNINMSSDGSSAFTEGLHLNTDDVSVDELASIVLNSIR